VCGGVRRTGEEESAICEIMAINCKPNRSLRLKGCLYLSLTLFRFLVMAALDSLSLPYVIDLVLFLPLLTGTVMRVDCGRSVM